MLNQNLVFVVVSGVGGVVAGQCETAGATGRSVRPIGALASHDAKICQIVLPNSFLATHSLSLCVSPLLEQATAHCLSCRSWSRHVSSCGACLPSSPRTTYASTLPNSRSQTSSSSPIAALDMWATRRLTTPQRLLNTLTRPLLE